MTVTILTDEPTIIVLAEQRIDEKAVLQMAEWVRQHRPNCVPEGGFETMWDLLPHNVWDLTGEAATWPLPPRGTNARALTSNEILAEIAGRSCYHSFAEAAGRKTNREYLEHIFSMDPMHSSILYHAKMTFFFAGVSRKFSHQFIRNYVGSDRDEEGSPSQESTRFTHHYGFYVMPPYVVDAQGEAGELWRKAFQATCEQNARDYNTFIEDAFSLYRIEHGSEPNGGARKDIYEAAAGILNMSAETSFVWTANAMSLRKFLKERCHEAADAEIDRFARKLARICFERWPNLFVGKDLDGVRARCEVS